MKSIRALIKRKRKITSLSGHFNHPSYLTKKCTNFNEIYNEGPFCIKDNILFIVLVNQTYKSRDICLWYVSGRYMGLLETLMVLWYPFSMEIMPHFKS